MLATNYSTTANPIVLTQADFDRLTSLVRSPKLRMTHSMLLTTLNAELSRGKVVPSQKVPKGTVTMRSRVRVRDSRTRESETYTLVFPEEANIGEGKLSVLAPLGTALLGARVGQTVQVNAPAGLRRLKIEKILYQPEAAGDFHL